MLLIFFFKCHQKTHYYIQDMSTRKGKEKNNSVKGTWVIELSQAIELKENQKFRPGEPNKTKRGARRTRMRSRDLFGQEESRSFRPGCQESERLEHKNYQRGLLAPYLKRKRTQG